MNKNKVGAKPLSLYIHIPFCAKKCGYCDFLSFSNVSDALFADYFAALEREIIQKSETLSEYRVETVFFGGGTPSLPPSRYIADALSLVFDRFSVSPSAEITTEANPETATKSALFDYRSAGFNRLSLGAQSFDDSVLRRIGRVHDSAAVVEAVRAARSAGFGNINLDLMFSLPDQSLDCFLDNVRRAADLGVEHISAYSLTLDEGVPLFGFETDEGDDRAQYRAAAELLSRLGYERYEISNFARRGYECRHNAVYWSPPLPYVGFGLGAHSLVGDRRFHNAETLTDYIADPCREYDDTILTEKDKIAEYFIMGLRMDKGVDVSNIHIYDDQLYKLQRRGLLTRDGGVVRLTTLGIDLSNQVFVEFI